MAADREHGTGSVVDEIIRDAAARFASASQASTGDDRIILVLDRLIGMTERQCARLEVIERAANLLLGDRRKIIALVSGSGLTLAGVTGAVVALLDRLAA